MTIIVKSRTKEHKERKYINGDKNKGEDELQ